ncbi:MAG: hypothetical protein IJZ89_01470 [Clostridia bacterium]|nr:hypothetical protein [Clostridia bacterium]
MKKILLILSLLLLLSLVFICYFFGQNIRDALSAKVTVICLGTHSFEGELSALAVPIECIRSDTSGYFIFIAEETDGGYRVKKQTVRINRKDAEYAEIKGLSDLDAYIIMNCGKEISESDRIVISEDKDFQ